MAWVQSVTDGYFAALQVPLLAGRLPRGTDLPTTVPVAAVSRGMARRWWPGDAAIGKRIRTGNGQWVEIVGIVGDVEHSVLDRSPAPTIYLPFTQAPKSAMDVAVRTATDAASLTPAIRAAVRAADPEQPINNMNTLAEWISQEAFVFVYMAALMGVFGVLALVLSSLGVYGVMSFVVAGQTQEIGIRMALGAERGAVLAMLYRRGMRTALAGLAIGIIPAYGLARLMRAAVFGVSAVSPAVFVGIPLVLAAGAAIAIYVPARRALRIDPMEALRRD